MRIILSPAKKMVEDSDSFQIHGLPQFLGQTEELLGVLRKLPYEKLKVLWKCSDRIAEQNMERLRCMDLRRLTPALLAYEGIAYQHMAPNVFTAAELEYAARHLRILSGFYGILRPFDGVVPYRLEMGAKLAVGVHKDLYGYWGGIPAKSLCAETDLIINLASKEYSRAVEPHLVPGTHFLTCVFGICRGGRLLEQGTACKMARGEMVRFMAENQIESPEQIRQFDRLGYHFDPERSDDSFYTFIREEKTPC